MGTRRQLFTCMVPQCRADILPGTGARGLCRSCYMSARNQIRLGNITWTELEEAGIAQRCLRNATGHATTPFIASLAQARKERKNHAE